jgi:hypothetical protein
MVTFLDGEVSIGPNFNRKSIKFDVLESQKHDKQIPELQFSKQRFEDVPKPTDIQPLEEKNESRKEVVVEKREVGSDFKADEHIFEVLAPFIRKGRKLRTLEFNLKMANSQDEVEKLLSTAELEGGISPEERN